MVATRVVPATASFYSARGIGSQASAGASVDEELRRAGKTCCQHRASGFQASKSVGLSEAFPLLYMFVMNCLGLEMVLCDLYLKTQGLLFDTFISTVWHKLYRCDHSVLRVRNIFTTNKLVDRIRNMKSNASRFKGKIYEKNAPQARDFMKQNAPQARLMKQNAPQAKVS